MYQTSVAFGDLIQQDSRTFRAKLTLGDDSIAEGIMSIRLNGGSNSEDDFSIGSAVSQYVEITMAASDTPFEGHEFLLELGTVVDDTVEEYVPMGYFTAEKPDTDEEQISFTAYDRMMKTERACFLELPEVTNTIAVLDAISTITGVTVVTTGLASISMDKPVGYTCREVLSYIAQMYGGFAVCNRQGQIEIRTYADSDYTVGTGRYWDTFTHNDYAFTLQKIICYTGRDEEGKDISITVGSGARGIEFSNPFMTKSVLNSIWEDLENFTYMPGGLKFLGDPRIDPWDILTVEDLNGNTYKVPAMKLSQDFDGGLCTEIEAVGKSEAEQESGFKGPNTRDMDRYYAQLVLLDHAVVNKLDADTADLRYASIERLEAVEASIQDLDVTKLTARVAIIENAYIARAEVNTLLADYASVAQLNAVNAQITNISGELSTYKTQVAGQFTAFDADITNLKAKDAELETALIGTAKVVDLDAVRTRTQTLESDVADINTLVNGNLTSDNIQSMVITGDKFTMENGFIKSAMIDTLDASKITGLDINTTKLTVHSDDGKSTWTDNTIQISDAARVRVQIGEDATGDYNIYIWDGSGNLMWNATGATAAGLNDGIIKDVAVAADANISGSKLDIESVIREVNGATTTIKGTRIKLDEQNQTLDVAFNTLKTYAEGVNSKTESNETAISVAQGQISTLISNTTIIKDGQTVQLKDAFNSTVADVSSIKTTLNEHTSLIDQQSGEILAVTTKANTIESDLNGTKQTVSAVQSDLSGTKSRVSTVESCLDGLKSRVTATETSLSKKADGTTVDSLTSRVATAESTLDGFEASLTTTVQKVSANEKNISSHDTRITAAENAISLKVSTSDYNAYKTTVNNEIASAKSRLSTAESSITTMQGQIALKVSQTDIDTAVNNLQIGGRNIALKTSTEKTLTGNNISNQCVSIYNMSKDWVEFAGKYIVISFDYTFSNDAVCTNSSYTNACIGIGMGASTWNRPAYIPAPSVAKSGHVIKSFFVPTNVSSHSFIQARLDYVTGTCTISNLKFELGTKATDWTPAPEDIDDSITAVDAKFANYSTTTQMTAAITAAKDSITQSVSSTYATKASVDTVSGKVTNLTSRVQTAESKLTKDSLVTTIGTYYATQTYAENIKATADSAKKEVYATFNGFGDSKAYCLLCQIKTNAPYINTPTVIEINQRGYGYSLCEIKFTSANNTDPTLQSIRKTGTPEWSIVKTATSTWDVYVKKSEAYDVITVVGFTKGAVPSVTWKCTNADLPSGTTLATQLAGMYGVDSTSGGTSGSNALITSGAAHSAISSVQTIATQTADKFNWLVKSGTSATDFTLTDRTATLVANAINLKGLVTFSGLDSAAQGKINTIDSINSFKFFTSNYSQSQSTLDSWAAEGAAGNWTVVEDTTGVRVGDMAAIRCYNTTTSAYVYILIKVTAISSATVLKGISHGYIDPNATAAAATAQSTANTANTTANTAKTNAATAQSTANTAKTNAAAAQSTADAAKTAAANAQSTANTAKSTADAAKSWTDTNGANMTNLRNMVLKWTNNAVSTSTTIQGGWIATNTITAEKMAIGDFTNYVTANESISTSVITGDNPFGDNLISGGYITKKAAGNEYMALTPYRVNSFDDNDELYYSFTIKSGKLAQCRIGIWFYGDGSVDNKTYKTCVLGNSHSVSLNNEVTFTGVLKLGACKGYGYYAIGIRDETSTKSQLFVKNVYVRKRSQGELIVDGSITAEKISVTSLSAISANLGTVTAGILKSANYKWTSAPFTDAGTYIDLSNGGIWTKNFTVDGSGNAYIRGQVTATSGTIGGFTIGSTNLHNNTTALAGAANSVYLGTDGISCGTAFKVTKAGTLTAASGTIGNLTVSSTGLSYGALNFGTSSFQLTKDTLSYGMFEVTKNGVTIGSSSAVTDGSGSLTVYDDLRFRDYSGSIRQPVASASADNARVAWVGSRISSGTQQFRVNAQWGTAGGSYTTLSFNPASSDIRLKENILPTEVEALPVLNSIGLYQFDWRQDHYHQRIGFVADYLQTVDSNLAIGGGYDEDGNMDIKVVNEFYLMGYVVKGIQEICTWTATYAAETDRALTSVRADLDYTRNMAISNQQRITCLEAQTQADNQFTQAQLASMQAQLQQALNRIAEQGKLIRQLQAATG